MKKILFLLLLVSGTTYAQYPNGIQTLGNDSNVVTAKGGLRGRVINFTHTDTAAANLQRVRQYPGAQIFTTSDNNFWLRNATATAWLQQGPSSATFYNSNIGSGYRLAIPNTIDIKTLFGAGILTIDSTTNANALTLTATEVDGSISNELQTISLSGTTTVTNTLSNGGGAWTLTGAGIAAISRTGNDVTITATEIDGSITNELQTLSTSGTSTPTVTLSNSGGSFSITGAGISVLSRAGDAFTVTSTEVDGSISNELQTIAVTGTTTGITTLSNSGGSMTIAGGGINTVGVSGSTITITGTEVDGSTTNEIQTLSGSGSTTTIITLSSGGGTFSVTGAGINVVSRSGTDITITGTEIDGSTSNELQTISVSGTTTGITTLSNGGGSMTIAGAGINTVGVSGSTITITGTEVDGSTSNEIQTISAGGTTSPTIDLSLSGGTVTFNGAGIVSLSRSSNTITITGTEAFLGTLTDVTATDANGFDFNITGTTVKNIALTTTAADTRVMFSASGAISSDADMVYNSTTNKLTVPTVVFGASNPYISATSTNDLAIYEGGGGALDLLQFGGTTNLFAAIGSTAGIIGQQVPEIYIFKADDSGYGDFATGGFGNKILTITGSDTVLNDVHTILVDSVDGNVTITLPAEDENPGQEYRIKRLYGGSDSVFIKSVTGDTVWATLMIENEVVLLQAHSDSVMYVRVNSAAASAQTLVNTSNSTSHTTTLSGPSGSVQFVEGSGISLATTGTSLDGILTITAADPSVTNELQSLTLSLGTATRLDIAISDGNTVSFYSGTGITFSNPGAPTGVTISADDVSATNELQTLAVTGTTTGITTLSNSGGSMTIAAAGINTIGVSGSTITITGTEVDGSTINEIQALAGTSDATSHTETLSISGGSFKLIEGTNITLTTSGTGLDAIITIASTAGTVTADNGLTMSTGTNVQWGGTLLQSTAVDGVDLYPITFDNSLFMVRGVHAAGTDPVTGAGTRMFFYPKKSALRAGYVSGTNWNASNIGEYSIAMGSNSKASGTHSISLGLGEATGTGSISLGGGISSGYYSITTGNSEATNDYATAMGVGTDATGYAAMSTGSNSVASGGSSIAMGEYTLSKSFGGAVVGAYNDATAATSATSFNSANRAFQIGIGSTEGTRKNAMTVLFTGETTLNQYGSGTFTGTAAYNLSVTSAGKIIETLAVTTGAGTYTPALGGGGTTNVSASTAHVCQYSWVKDPTSGLIVVTVSGYVEVDPTTTLTDTKLEIALPLCSSFTNIQEAGGTAAATAISGQSAGIRATASGSTVTMQWLATDITNQPMYFSFTYKVNGC